MACCLSAFSCSCALSTAIAACEAMLASTSRSSFWKRCRWSEVSTWITPSELPSLSTSGAHIIERMRKSAMLWLVSNRESLAASADSTASWFVHHLVDDRAADAHLVFHGRRGDA